MHTKRKKRLIATIISILLGIEAAAGGVTTQASDIELSNNVAKTSFTAEKAEILPVKYSSVEQGYTTKIRNQNPYGTCWAHAAIAAMEISMVKNGMAEADSLGLSVPHEAYYYYRPVTDPLGGTADDYAFDKSNTVYGMLHGGGSPGYLAETTMAWIGPVLTENFYSESELLANYNTVEDSEALNNKEDAYGERVATITEYVSVDTENQEEMKRAILEYGAVTIGYYSSAEYFSPSNAAQYCNVKKGTNHAVVVVGWDDSFSKENFYHTPRNDGAWLVKNSWGVGYGKLGYCWISYEDQTIDGGKAFRAAAVDKYDNNYQYDGVSGSFDTMSCAGEKTLETVNVFEIQNEFELLKGVNFATWEAGYNYSIQLYKNPKNQGEPDSGEALLTTPITGVKELAGRYTIDLEQPIRVKKGDKIGVSVTYSVADQARTPIVELDRPAACVDGTSYYRISGEGWKNCSATGKGNFLTKLYTATAQENHIHSWDESWSYDADAHWHECNAEGGCDATLSHEDRGYEKHYGGKATCSAKPVCEGCGKEYGHILTNQHIGDTECITCGKAISPEERMGIANFNWEFQTLTGEKVSAAANGKPKLIIMFGAKCTISIATFNSLVKENISGVDICAVETNLSSKATVESMVRGLDRGEGFDNIKFCYEPDLGMNIRYAYTNAYQEIYPDAKVESLPIIFYVNERNEIKYMTSGFQDIESVKRNLSTYCGYKVKGLNIPNPSDASFTSVDETEITLKAEDKPKVLIFYYAVNCEESERTLYNFSENLPEGVDFIAVEIFGRDKETILNFRDDNSIRDGGIQFTYDGAPIDILLDYMRKAGVDTSQFSTPVVCYIDSNNYLQHVTEGIYTNDEMRVILDQYCDFKETKEADYSAVDAAIAEAEALNEADYVDFTAVTDAVNAVVRGKDITKQAEVDAMAQAIRDAIAALEKKLVDKTALAEAITEAETLVEDNYIADGWTEFKCALSVAISVNENDNASQEDVDQALAGLEVAQEALELKPADYSEVDAAIAEAEALDEADYVDFTAVTDAVNAVVRGKDITEQAEVDAMAQAIRDAIAALEEKPVDPQPPVEPAIDNIAPGKTVTVSGTSNFVPGHVNDEDTNTRWDSNLIKSGQGANASDIGDAWIYIDLGTDVRYEISQIVVKFYNLVYPTSWVIHVSDDATNWDDVTDVLTKENAGPAHPVETIDFETPFTGRYVRLYFNTLNTVAAGHGVGITEFEIYGTESDEQPPVVTPVDKAALAAAIAEAEELTADAYTADSWADFQTALAAAKTVNANADATQEAVDTALANLAAAQEALEEKPVDPQPPVEPVNPFEDVYDTDYYYDSVRWAVQNGITDGWTATTFAPEMGCTRGQVVTFLWRAAGEPKVQDAENPFTDVAENAYYYDAVLWAVENGITDGWTEDSFAPDMTCTRGQIVTFIWRAAGEPETADENPFTDIAENAYYYDAVLWAVENQITDGWLPTEFAPEMECTRGQIVTFLYRNYN